MTIMNCSICGQKVALNIAHCRDCGVRQCSQEACRTAQDLICKGEHVHADDSCLTCKGDLSEIECPAVLGDRHYIIRWEPCILDAYGSVYE